MRFRRGAVSNSGNTTGSVNNRNSIGSAWEYLVGVDISKTNLFVGDKRVEVAILKLNQPYLSNKILAFDNNKLIW